VNGGEVRDEGGRGSLEDLELCRSLLDDGRDLREEDCAQNDEALAAFFVAQLMKTGRIGVFCMPATCYEKVIIGIARRYIGKRSSWNN
jgi:hypothetical protein